MEGVSESVHSPKQCSARAWSGRSFLHSNGSSSIVHHLQHLWCYCVVLLSSVFIVNTALVSARLLSFRFPVPLRASLLNFKTYYQPPPLHFSSHPASLCKSLGLPLGVISVSPATISDCRCLYPMRICLTSVATLLSSPERRHNDPRTFPFVKAKGVVDCFQRPSCGRHTHQGHERRWVCSFRFSSKCTTRASSAKRVCPCESQSYTTHARVMTPITRCAPNLQNKMLPNEERTSAHSGPVSGKGRTKKPRDNIICSNAHPLKHDATWSTTAFVTAHCSQASFTAATQQPGASSASTASKSPVRSLRGTKSISQANLLSSRTEPLQFCVCKKLAPRPGGSLPSAGELLYVDWEGPSSFARVNCTVVKAAGSPVDAEDKWKILNDRESSHATRDAMGTPSFNVKQSHTSRAIGPGQASSTPSSGGAREKEPAESFIDVNTVKNIRRGYIDKTPPPILTPGEDGDLVRGVANEFENNSMRPPDQVLSGEKRGRLTVTLSNNHVHACVVDNRMQRTYAYASSRDRRLLPVIGVVRRRRGLNPRPHGGTMKAALAVGRLVAERALAKGIKKVFFDRKCYRYIGRVKALADGAREGGLDF